MGKKGQNVYNVVKTTKFMLLRIWKRRAGKLYILLSFLLSIIDAVGSFVPITIPGLIINQLLGRTVTTILVLYMLILVFTPVLCRVINILINQVMFGSAEQLQLEFVEEFYQHITFMDYETLEKPSIQEKKDRAMELLNNSLMVVEQVCRFFGAAVNLFFISSIIILLNPLVICASICTICANAVITKHLNQKNHVLDQKIAGKKRKKQAMAYMLDSFEFAKDLRLYNIRNLLIDKFLTSEEEINVFQLKKDFAKNKSKLLSILLEFINQLIIYIYLIYMVIERKLAVGSMTIFLSASARFFDSLKTVMETWMSLAANALKVDDYLDFIDIPKHQYHSGNLEPEFDKNSVIEFRYVSFRYPGSERYAVRNLNITIQGNEKLCVVGTNGAGKSTFVKLLTRLYAPTEGEILLNGINIKDYNYEKYQKLFAPVFQDYSEFYLTIGENIVLADTYDRKRLDEVCEEVGITQLINKLPKKYDTQVSKWIDEQGIEPSGGEGQRIAIARACYHGGAIYLLDEPTAALDPNAEYEIYKQFHRMIANKCAILITHRLAATQLADKILIFHDGELIECGTHQELYQSNLLYKNMFNKQAQFYQTEEQ